MNDEWLRQARTSETRVRIRRWSHRADFYFWVGLLAGVGGIAYVVWSVVTQRAGGPAFWGVIAGAVVLVLLCVGFGSHASGQLAEARYADGHLTAGWVTGVIEHTGGEGPDTYDLEVEAELPGAVTIRREIRGCYGSLSVGDRIEFRHNTVEPDDVDDVLYERAVRSAQGTHAGIARPSRQSFADARVSIGTVDDVVSYPAHPDDALPADYLLAVSVANSKAGTVRRRVYVSESQLRSTGPRFGRTIYLRHNTVDPDELDDAFFDGWAD